MRNNDQDDQDDNFINFSSLKQQSQNNKSPINSLQNIYGLTGRNKRVQDGNLQTQSNHKQSKSYSSQMNNNIKLNYNSQNNQYQPTGSPGKDIIESSRSMDKSLLLNNFKDLIIQQVDDRKVENETWQKSPIESFQKSAELFKGLTHKQLIKTFKCEVVNIVISNDATHAVIIGHEYRQKIDKDHFEIQVFSLTSYFLIYKHEINGNYVKMSQIEQDQNGTLMAIPYQDNGVFFLTVIDVIQKQTYNFNVSNILQIDKESVPITGFDDPFITCAFFPENSQDQQFTQIFISVYHRIEMINYYFSFSTKTKQVVSKIGEVKLQECSIINFPIKTFYSQEANEFYTFFRQGHGVTVVKDESSDFKSRRFEKITNADFGSMYLLFDKALIVRSSSSILFFKIDEETNLWTQYHIIPKIRGEIFFIQGNVRFQVTTDEKIYFFLMDKETLFPNLENVMYNFMGCSQMMFGKKVRNCITFKANQPDFQLYQRKGFHNFKIELSQENHEGALGANLASLNAYIIADKRHISIHQNEQFNQAPRAGWEWDVPSFEKNSDIVYMAISQDQGKIAILLGQKIMRDRKKLTEIVVYFLNKHKLFQLEQRRIFEFNDACIQFFFSVTNSNELLFFTKKELFKYNYQQQNPQKETIYYFLNEFNEQPTFSYMNYDQTKFILTSNQDMLFVDLHEQDPNKKEIDIDDRTGVSHIKSCMGDESYFYILANKKEGKLGFYLLRFDLNNPEKEVSFLICWNNKLDIADCDMNLMTENLTTEINGEKVDYINRQMVVSYKMIGINTYNVFVFDLLDSEMNLIKYWHESYQLWESQVKGFLLSTNDFLILSKDGLNLISLGETTKKKMIEDSEKQKRLIHPLGSLNYLKIEPTNHILFACQYYDDRQICIQTQYNDKDKNTNFDDIYKIKIEEPTLRELLLMQSIYSCKTQSDIELLVSEQPEPSIFFKIFLELETKNLIQHIAFDSRSIKRLLDKSNSKYFDDKFPIFYKNEEGNSAIDIAIENNQIRSVNLMIDYICEYQNVFVYSHLFKFNIIDLIEKGVTMVTLFESKLLTHTFDYDYWPATSPKTDLIMAPYNKSIFELRSQYPDIFKELFEREEFIRKQIERDEEKGKKSNYFQYKIKYKINLLTSMAQEEDLITAIAESDELKIFETEVVRQMIDYKWEKFALSQIKIGAIVHLVYVVMLVLYVKLIFLDQVATVPSQEDESSTNSTLGDGTKGFKGGKSQRRNKTLSGDSTSDENSLIDDIIFPLAEKNYLIVLAVCLCYPIWYDGTQLLKSGLNYFYQGSNYIDIVHISMGFLNIYMQIYVGTWDYVSKIILIIVILTSLKKTFAYMRIFKEFSSIVTMINCVIIDLRIFMVFFSILIVFFSIILDVIGRNKSAEYEKVGYFTGGLLTTLRLSLGDFDFTLIEGENLLSQNIIFWVVWIIAVIFSSLIFLNFIIAEVSASYEKVKEEIEALIYKERALLIAEAEDIIPKSVRLKNKEFFPEYIVIRQLED